MKITPDEIAAKIKSVEYIHHDMLTFCVITMLSGFKVTGQAACANAADYDKPKGEKMAYRDAFSKLFLMEGYMQRDRAHEKTQPQEKAA
jgi:hypothetical protein